MTCIHSAQDLITSHEQPRAGFIEAAMAKNEKAKPYIVQARTLKSIAQTFKHPVELINQTKIYSALLTAAGLSDKACKHFEDEDKRIAIEELVDKFLEPAGENWVDELVYRFLLIKGDSLGGSMRNHVGAIAQRKLVRKILCVLSIQETPFILLKNKSKHWIEMRYESAFDIADKIKAITWKIDGKPKILFFNSKIPLVKNNVDICLYEGDNNAYDKGQIVKQNELAIMFGELKGGIDPAGADEHWKTGNSALERVRSAFSQFNIKTSFIAAGIETKMANEIFDQLKTNTLSKAANITVDEQLTEYCQWLINL